LADSPDDDLKQSNDAHKAFIDVLKSAWDVLGGAAWRERKSEAKDTGAKKSKLYGESKVQKAEVPDSMGFLTALTNWIWRIFRLRYNLKY